MIALRRGGAAVGRERRRTRWRRRRRSSWSIGSRSPISPVEHTATSPAPMPERARRRARRCGGCRGSPSGPVHALAPPELSTTARTTPARSTCCDHSTGAAFTRLRVNTPAAADCGPSLTHEGDVRVAAGLQPGDDAGRAEARGCGDAHGATPIAVRPAPSSRPSARLAFCSAWPAAPLPRLSMARRPRPRARSAGRRRPAGARRWRRASRRSAATRPAGSTVTNGSSAYAACSASCSTSVGDALGEPGRGGGEDARAASARAPA